MNFSKFLLMPAFLMVTMAACDEAPTPPKTGEVLNQAPYKSITDSISQHPDIPGMYLERAIRLSQHNKLELATPDFQKAWELSQDPGVALEYVSNLLLVDNVPEAVSVLKDCAQKFPEHTEFNRRLGEIYSETGDTKGALAQFDDILLHEPDNFEAWYDKGTVLAKMKDTGAAIKALERSFSLQPINYTGIALANLYISQKNPRALQICNYLIQKDTANVQTDAVYAKGVYYSETGNPALALQQFEECIKRDWKLTDAYIEKGIIFYEQKRLDTALKTFNMSITVSNTNPDGYFWIGRCYEAMKDNDRAIENYQRALSLDRTFVEARDRISKLKKS
jgi:tetratricopeptide (TPR) repeat protein